MQTKTASLLNKIMDYSVAKQRAISDNIANISTANYQRKDIDFADYFKESEEVENLKLSDRRHLELKGGQMIDIKDPLDSSKDVNVSGKNNVNIDKEMADMAKNTLLFKFAARRLNSHFKQIENVIEGGR